jgi:hypothetical protein
MVMTAALAVRFLAHLRCGRSILAHPLMTKHDQINTFPVKWHLPALAAPSLIRNHNITSRDKTIEKRLISKEAADTNCDSFNERLIRWEGNVEMHSDDNELREFCESVHLNQTLPSHHFVQFRFLRLVDEAMNVSYVNDLRSLQKI